MKKEYFAQTYNIKIAEKFALELEKFRVRDVIIHSPEIIDLPSSKSKPHLLGISAFLGGIAGIALSLLFQYWISSIDYPINVGGKPFFGFIYSIPVTFAIMTLFAALAVLISFMFMSGLPNWNEKKIGNILLPSDKYIFKFSVENNTDIESLNIEGLEITELI